MDHIHIGSVTLLHARDFATRFLAACVVRSSSLDNSTVFWRLGLAGLHHSGRQCPYSLMKHAKRISFSAWLRCILATDSKADILKVRVISEKVVTSFKDSRPAFPVYDNDELVRFAIDELDDSGLESYFFDTAVHLDPDSKRPKMDDHSIPGYVHFDDTKSWLRSEASSSDTTPLYTKEIPQFKKMMPQKMRLKTPV